MLMLLRYRLFIRRDECKIQICDERLSVWVCTTEKQSPILWVWPVAYEEDSLPSYSGGVQRSAHVSVCNFCWISFWNYIWRLFHSFSGRQKKLQKCKNPLFFFWPGRKTNSSKSVFVILQRVKDLIHARNLAPRKPGGLIFWSSEKKNKNLI